jgi:hypothetical protein
VARLRVDVRRISGLTRGLQRLQQRELDRLRLVLHRRRMLRFDADLQA